MDEVKQRMAKMPKVPPGAGFAGAGLLGLAGLGYGVLNYCLFNVEGGQRAIVFNRVWGVKDHVYKEGTHLIVPFLDKPIIYKTRATANQVQSTSGSKDLQMVNLSLRVLTRPVPEKLPTIYRTLGRDYAERVLPSILQETMKSVIAKYKAAQLLQQREEVSAEIRRVLEERARHFHIALEDVSITNLTFGREYTAAVEAKQVAQQEAERALFVVEKAVQEKKGAVIRAEGEAKSAELIGKAISQNPAFLSLRRIEAAREIAGTVSNSTNRVFLNADSLMLNMNDVDTSTKRR